MTSSTATQVFIAAGERFRAAQLAHEAAPSTETEEAMRAAGRAVLRAAENLPARLH